MAVAKARRDRDPRAESDAFLGVNRVSPGPMAHPVQKRCSECDARFIPIACIGARQRVCSRQCRLQRRAKGARRRRAAEIQDHRVDERERQAVSRARRKTALAIRSDAEHEPEPMTTAPPSLAGHEPSSPAITPKQLDKVDEIVDRILGRITHLSRAELRREVAMILRASAPFSGSEPRPPRPRSRAELSA